MGKQIKLDFNENQIDVDVDNYFKTQREIFDYMYSQLDKRGKHHVISLFTKDTFTNDNI